MIGAKGLEGWFMLIVFGSQVGRWDESSCLEDLNQSKRPIVSLLRKALSWYARGYTMAEEIGK